MLNEKQGCEKPRKCLTMLDTSALQRYREKSATCGTLKHARGRNDSGASENGSLVTSRTVNMSASQNKAATPYQRTLAYDERQREAGKVRLSVWVDPEDRQALRDAAEAGGETVGDVITRLRPAMLKLARRAG